jgi:hypothetical protein
VSRPPTDDAQRELEQHALRNVRGLVDKMDSIEKLDKRAQRRLLLGIVVGAIMVIGFIVGAVLMSKNRGDAGRTIVIEPVKAAPKADPAAR